MKNWHLHFEWTGELCDPTLPFFCQIDLAYGD